MSGSQTVNLQEIATEISVGFSKLVSRTYLEHTELNNFQV